MLHNIPLLPRRGMIEGRVRGVMKKKKKNGPSLVIAHSDFEGTIGVTSS